MSKHTPGPWSVDAGYIVGLADPENAETIAEFGDAEPSEADARLIAAAPELAAALQYVLECIERGDTTDMQPARDALQQAGL
jgi:hypothetical protein